MKRNYLGLWSLLAAAFAFFTLLSSFDSIEVGGYAFKTAGIHNAIFAPGNIGDDTLRVSSDSDGVCSLPLERPAIPAELDTTAQTILFIGDSMLEGLSKRLAAYCETNGHKLYTVIWYSSSSERWGKSDRLRDYIRKIKPTFVFVCLGSNELFVSNIEEKRSQYVANIISDIGDIPYVWIGPPNWKPDTGINRLIASKAAEGCFFLSDGMTFERKKDGAHPTSASAALWMDSVVRWMPGHAAHPIRLTFPDRQSGSATRVFVHQPDEK